MTSNQIAYQEHLENVRSNMTRERETERDNRAKLAETNRSNLVKEKETQRSNLANEAENVRWHKETSAETKRHNLFGEQLSQSQFEETKRANRVQEAEKERSNRANEASNALQAQARYLGAQASAIDSTTRSNELEAKRPIYAAQAYSETQKAINFGSATKLNLAKVNESKASAANTRAKTKTENWQRLPNTIRSYTGIATDIVRSTIPKLFGGKS